MRSAEAVGLHMLKRSRFDVANARLLARAILECCDRIDGVEST